MATYDWIVIGAGMTGAALSYELVSQGFSVLLLEQAAEFPSATRYSYGGIAYWSGTTELTRQLCAEGIARHRSLSDELAASTHFVDGDLLLTIPADADPQAIAASYAHFALPPRLLDVAAACALEPLLNPRAIAAALTVKHGRIDPIATTRAYLQAFQRRGAPTNWAASPGCCGAMRPRSPESLPMGNRSTANRWSCAPEAGRDRCCMMLRFLSAPTLPMPK